VAPRDQIVLGIVGAAHGIRGEVRIKTFTGDPLAIGSYGPVDTPDGRRFKVLAVRPLKGDMVIAKLQGISDRTAAEKLTHTELRVSRSALPEPDEDEFYHADLIGCTVETESGERIGTVASIHDFGAGDIIEISRPGREPLTLTFTRAAVPVIDLAARRLVVVLPAEIEARSNDG
jgi:16S rRNA processing protein RimM